MKISFLILLFCLSATGLLAQNENKDIPPRPNPARLVNDLTKSTLDAQEIGELEIKLRRLNDTSSSQVAVVILRSVGSYDIADYSNQLFKKWGIGQKAKNNGVLLLIAMEDHKSHIEVGYGLEGVLTDLESKQILDNILRPAFRDKQYYNGIDKTTAAIAKAVAGEYKGTPVQEGDESDTLVGFIIIILILFFILFIFFRGGRRGGGFSGGAPFIFFGGGGSTGGYDNGGGSSFDFGGGDSGGGGASSDW